MLMAILFLFIAFIEGLAFIGLSFLTAVLILTAIIDFIDELKD